MNKVKWSIFTPAQETGFVKEIASGGWSGFGTALTWDPSQMIGCHPQKDPKICIQRRCSTIRKCSTKSNCEFIQNTYFLIYSMISDSFIQLIHLATPHWSIWWPTGSPDNPIHSLLVSLCHYSLFGIPPYHRFLREYFDHFLRVYYYHLWGVYYTGWFF